VATLTQTYAPISSDNNERIFSAFGHSPEYKKGFFYVSNYYDVCAVRLAKVARVAFHSVYSSVAVAVAVAAVVRCILYYNA